MGISAPRVLKRNVLVGGGGPKDHKEAVWEAENPKFGEVGRVATVGTGGLTNKIGENGGKRTGKKGLKRAKVRDRT